MARKNVWVFLFLFGILFTLAGCDFLKKTTTMETTVSPTIETTTESVLTLRLKEIYNLAVAETNFDGTYEEWLETVRGPEGVPGEDGREIDLQVASGYIQWSYKGSLIWTNLVSLEALRGETGVSGKQALLRVNSGYIQWQYSGDTTWNNLIAISLLTGADGSEVIFQVDGGYLQYQYIGDLVWINLIEIASLIGPQGEQGIPGVDGQEIILRVNDTYLEWSYVGTESWYFLYDLVNLKGQDASFPVISINNEGYWVIDGIVQTQKAYTLEKYTVTFEMDGGLMPGEYPLTIEVEKGTSLSLPIPYKEGYIFTGWITGYTINDVLFNNYLPITKNITLFATWEVDEQLLYDLFEIVNEDHFFNYTMNVDFTNGIDNFYYDFTQNYYFYSSALEPYEYLSSNTLFNLPLVLSGETTSIEYNQFDEQSGDYVSILTRNGSPWIFDRFLISEKYDHYLSNIDPSAFEKRPDALIYDYTGDMSYFEKPFVDLFFSFGIGISTISNYTEQYCELDLLNQTITYYAVGTSDIPTVGMSTFVFSVVYDFNDFDSSLVSVPFEEMKQVVVDRFDIEVANKYADEYIDYVLESSLLTFDALVLEKQTLLSSISTLVELANFYLYDNYLIRYFSFEYDENAIYRSNIIDLMEGIYLNKTITATPASITEMSIIYQQYELLVLNLTEEEISVDHGNVLFYEFALLIEEAYVIDLEKISFSAYRESMANNLTKFITYLSETFENELEHEQYNMLVFSWIDNIRSQTTKESVLLSYNQAISEITSFVYTIVMPENFIFNYTDIAIQEILNFGYVSIDPGAYQTYVLNISQDLYLYTDLNLWVLEIINVSNMGHAYLISELTLYKTPEITGYVDDLITKISDENIIILQAQYDELMLLLPESSTAYTFNELIDAFYKNTAKIPFDSWKLAQIEANVIVEEEYNYLMLTASTETQIYLTDELNNYYLALTSLVVDDLLGLESLKDLTLNNFILNYVSAPEYVDLFLTKEEYLQLWEEFYLIGIPYVDLSFQSLDSLEETYSWYRYQIRYAASIMDIHNLYVDGINNLNNFPVVYLPFDYYIESLILIETEYVDNWQIEYNILDGDTYIYLDQFIEFIYWSNSPYSAYCEYLNYKDIIDNSIIYDMVEHYQNILNQAYTDYFYSLDSVYISSLNDIYGYYFDLLNVENVWSNFPLTIDNFHAEVAALLPTPWELALEEAQATINSEYDYRMLTASIASQALLTEDFDEFNLAILILAVDDYPGLDLLISNTISSFDLDYETDPLFEDIYQAKMEYLQKWEEFYLIGLPYVNLELRTIDELEDIYLNYRQSIRLMTSISAFESTYYQGRFVLSNLLFDYISITPLTDQLILEMTNYVDAWKVAYPLNYYSVDGIVDDFIANIYGYTSPYSTYDLYLFYLEQVNYYMIEDMVLHYQIVLDQDYNFYYLSIDPSYYDDLDNIYFNHWQMIANETVWENFQIIIDNFHADVSAMINP